MHAMVIESSGRHAILLGRNASYPAPAAFTLAHEIGHIACGHTRGTLALIDVEDPALAKDRDTDESQADAFALSILTGSPAPEISTQFEDFNAPTLADAVLKAGPQYRIEPGTLALCVAYRKKNWPVAMSAMRFIYSESKPVWKEVNRIAGLMLDWDAIGADGSDFIRNLMNRDND
jgi:Zn-dependent peptidase ImmA (M78 family)